MMGAIHLRLTADDLKQIFAVLPPGAKSGERYPERAMRAVSA